MRRVGRWSITIASGAGTFVGAWVALPGLSGVDPGTSLSVAGTLSALVTLPLAWWAGLSPGAPAQPPPQPPGLPPAQPPGLPPGPAAPPDAAEPPRGWWMPLPRNREFVGRDTVLAALADALMSRGSAVVHALRGQGGIGKTQVAAEYAYRFAHRYRIVWWISAEDSSLLGEQLTALATVLGVARPGDSAAVVHARLRAHLHQRDDWLLIFDNAQGPALVEQWLPDGGGHVLITSRSGGWQHVAVTIDLDPMTRGESVALLRSRRAGLSEADAARIADAVGNLPLALIQAGGFMASSGVSVDVYLATLATAAAATLDEGPAGPHTHTVTSTVTLSVRRLAEINPDAVALLRVCALLAPEPIPTQWLIEPSLSVDGPAGRPDATPSALATLRAIGHLIELGLATGTEDGPQLHRLTRAVVADQMSPDQRERARTRSRAVLTRQAPTDTDDPRWWPQWARLLPHLLAADLATADTVELRRLASDAARYLLQVGDITAGRDLAANLYLNWQRRLGSDDDATLTAAQRLAHAYDLQGRHEQARQLDQDTLERRRRVSGEDHPDTLRLANNLALDLRQLGEYEQARQLDEDTLARRQRVLGDDHPFTLRSAGNLAFDLRKLGEYEQARQVDEDTLTRRRRVLGDDHPDTLLSATSLASDLRHTGDYARALELDESAFVRFQRVLGVDHPDTLHSATGLALDLHQAGEYERARQLSQDTLVRRRRVLGDEHPETLRSAGNLALHLYQLGEYEQARQLDEETLSRFRRVLGDDHPDTREVARNLAADLRQLGEHEQARQLDEDTVRRVRGDGSPR